MHRSLVLTLGFVWAAFAAGTARAGTQGPSVAIYALVDVPAPLGAGPSVLPNYVVRGSRRIAVAVRRYAGPRERWVS